MTRGRPPAFNLRSLGPKSSAREVANRIWNKGTACRCWVLPDGGVVIREHREQRYRNPPDDCLLGTYTRQASTRQIERDLRLRLKEIAA